MKKEIIHTFVVLAYKESPYLEECIKSVQNQKYKSEVVIATSTPNDFITKIAKKYKLDIIVNKGKKGIGYDFDFAIKAGKTKLVTVAHQDDIYDYEYSSKVVEYYNKYNDALIIFPNYYEMRDTGNTTNGINMRIKNILLKPLLNIERSNELKRKRKVIAYGCSICCPAVTFNKDKVRFPVYASELKCDVDWNAWERLSKLDGRFVYIPEHLMGHRIHSDSTTTAIIKDNIRTKEDYEILKRFHNKVVAYLIAKVYSLSEISNGKK